MSGEQMQYALEAIEPGESLGQLKHTSPTFGTVRVLCEFREGVIPQNSELSARAAYVATDIARGDEQVVIAVENRADGEAVIDVEPLTTEAESDTELLQGVMRQALAQSRLQYATLNPASPLAELPPQILQAAGFVEADGLYQLAA